MPPTAILAFFSPCGYRLPQRHLAQTLNWLIDQGFRVVCAQVVKPGQTPQYVPPQATRLVYESEDVLFYKENLWNLAARESQSDSLFFFDADVYIRGKSWLRDSLRLLESHDFIQPFEAAAWTARDNTVEFTRPPTAAALVRRIEPHPGKYHPGFAWGFRSDFFKRLGGWYDRHPAGGSDTAFAYAMNHAVSGGATCPPSGLLEEFCKSRSFSDYCDTARSLAPRPYVTRGAVAVHRWHGSWSDRGYSSRDSVFPIGAGGEYEVEYREDGLLQWAIKGNNSMSRKYFEARKEDG